MGPVPNVSSLEVSKKTYFILWKNKRRSLSIENVVLIVFSLKCTVRFEVIKNVPRVLRNIFAYKLMDSGLVMDLKRLRYKMVGHSHTSKCGIHHKKEDVIPQCLRK